MADSEADLTGGIAAAHPEPEIQTVVVAPTIETAVNTVRAYLIPVGCWRIDDVRFDFDSSFVRAAGKKEFALLAKLVKDHPGCPMSIFGHADPTGSDDYNKTLSGRRARAIYGLLTRDTGIWEDLYSHSFGGDTWGVRSIQKMLFELGEDTDLTGVMDSKTIKALKSFQTEQGQSPNGTNNAATRAVLFKAYMDSLCVDGDGGQFQLTAGDFLAKGADPDGKGDYQGCGEFNPVLMFSAAEKKDFDKPQNHNKRNSENAPNRRVMALLFRKNTVVDPGKWPCPTWKDGVDGCTKRFWSDADTRRQFQDNRRTFEADKNTYACRFYHRLAELSPCGSAAGPNSISVVQVKASVPGSKGIRNTANQRARSVLAASTSTETDLTQNKPVVLVRGCNDVELEAVTNPSAPVTWTVTPNENSNSAPDIIPAGGGKRAFLKTDKAGAFSVTASTGASKVVWNVVFVSVNVDVSSGVVITRDNLYVDNGSSATRTRFRSGQFVDNQYAWEITVAKVEVVGGGTNNDIGVADVQLRYLQNGIEDTLSGNYDGGATATEVPKGGLPIVDSNGDAGTNPTADLMLKVTPDNTSKVRTARLADSPAGGFPRTHPNTKGLLAAISGVNGFRAAVGSTSTAAPDAFVVHAELQWKADFAGSVAKTGSAGTYTRNGARTTSDVTMSLISPDTGGQDAGVAGYELFEPRFNGGTDTKFNP